MPFKTILHMTAAAFLIATPVLAQDAHSGHSMSGMSTPGAPTDFYKDAMERMHKDMATAPTGDADVDFVRGMIPHHQGAIDMAKAVLAHGKDPEIRKLAEDVITAQEGEITFMQEWLKKHGQ